VDAILEGAAQVLVRAGYDRATTGLVAEAAGVSVGSIYQYFPNKDAIFSELLARELEESYVVVTSALAASAETGFEGQLRVCIGAVFAYKGSNPRLHHVLKTELGRIDGVRHLKRLNERSLTLTTGLLTAHQKELRLRDPGAAAFLLVSAIDGIVAAALLSTPALLTDPKWIDQVVAMLAASARALGRG
jgi:AcrR family transcriptional regulator